MKNARLIELRENNNLTQEQLGSIVGLSQSTIARIENGERETKRHVHMKLAKHFDVSVEWLFYEQVNDL